MFRLAALASIALLAFACTTPEQSSFATHTAKPKKKTAPTATSNGSIAGDGDGDSTEQETSATLPTGTACGKIDILFVIDDSGSMFDKQASLAAAFPDFIAEIAATNGGTLDYRVAMTTSSNSVVIDDDPAGIDGPGDSVAADGALVNNAVCGMSRAWLERSDADVASTFSCAAQVGIGGSVAEMPLYGMKSALAKAKASGQFLREDALLAIVFLTDEDDGSQAKMHYATGVEAITDFTQVDSFGTFLDDLKGNHDRWATAVIAGTAAGCTAGAETAEPARRLGQFASLAGKHGSSTSICESNLGVSLKDVLATFQTACQDFPPVVK